MEIEKKYPRKCSWDTGGNFFPRGDGELKPDGEFSVAILNPYLLGASNVVDATTTSTLQDATTIIK